jgi:glycine/D-amino acid oxidase-like deaminating enzyme
MVQVEKEIWDYIIVGAGVLGVATAYYLKKKLPNKKILLIDKYSGAGFGNTGKSNAAYRNTTNFYKFMEKKGSNLDLKEVGYLWLLTEDQFTAKNQPSISIEENNTDSKISLLDFLNTNNIEYEIFNKDELRDLLPFLKQEFAKTNENNLVNGLNIKYGFLGKQCGALDPSLVVKMYEKLFKDLNGNTRYNTEVLQILLREKNQKFDEDYFTTVWRDSQVGGLKLRNTKSNKISILKTDNLILTTGAWINQLLDPIGINSSVKPKKRQLFRLCGLEGFVNNEKFKNKQKSIPFLILPIGGVFIKPIPEVRCVDVGTSDDIGRRFETRTLESEKKENLDNRYLDNPQGELEFYLTNVLPVLELYFPMIFTEEKRIDNPSAGMYAYTLDKFPIVEKNQNLGNLTICSGASGSGIMKADAIARICVSAALSMQKCELFDKSSINVSDFSIRERNLPKETLIL